MEGKMMQEIIKSAVSFPGIMPPVGSREVFRQTVGSRTYIYYEEKPGTYYYDSVEGLAFKRKMAETERKQRIRHYRDSGQAGGKVATGKKEAPDILKQALPWVCATT